MQPIMTFVGNLGYVAVAIVGSIFAANGIITIGDIQAFIQYVRNFTQPIQQLAQVSNMLQSMAAAAERYAGLNDPTPAHRRALLRQKLELEPENEETLWELFESAVTHVCIGKGGEISLSQKDQKECAS